MNKLDVLLARIMVNLNDIFDRYHRFNIVFFKRIKTMHPGNYWNAV